MTGRDVILSAESISKSFGAVRALGGVSLSIEIGECRGIIGANGAGKSTLFGVIARHISADSGSVTFNGTRLDRLPAHQLAKLGLAIVFQEAMPFLNMTVEENIMVGGHATIQHGFISAAMRLPRCRHEEKAVRTHSRRIMDQLGLSAFANEYPQDLPFGVQRLVQIGRALCSHPRLLLLDEPASGLRFDERAALRAVLSTLNADGLTMMLVEHDVRFVFALAQTITALDLGMVIAEGPGAAIRDNVKVIEAYLGVTPDA